MLIICAVLIVFRGFEGIILPEINLDVTVVCMIVDVLFLLYVLNRKCFFYGQDEMSDFGRLSVDG